MKNLLRAILITIGIILLLMLGFKTLVKSIYKSKDCEMYNIDNIELRTGIDIPKVLDVNCEFNDSTNTKVAVFTLDTSRFNLSEYIIRNKFEKVDSIFKNTGDENDSRWAAELEPVTASLRVELEYKS